MRAALVVFENRNYRLLWTSSLFSFTGMHVQMVARALLAWQLTESFGAVGAISLSFGLPMLLFSLIGGSLADRLEKRNLTLFTQTATGALALVTAVLVVTGIITIELLFIIGLVQGTFFAFGMPARGPLMAEVVGREQLMSAMAMSNAAMNATRLVGPALAAVLVAVGGIETAYFAQAGLYVVSALVLLLVPTGLSEVARGGARPPQGNMFVEIGHGLRYVATDPKLRLLLGMLFIMTFFAMPYVVLLPGFVQEDLGRGDAAYGVLQSISGAGALVGSLAVATLTGFTRKPLIQWGAGLLGGSGLILLALGSATYGFAGAIGAVIVLGLAMTAYQTLNNAMTMSEARPEYYGRVMSINMLTFSAMPIMAYPLGALADTIGARETFIAQGVIVLAFMVLVAVVNRGYTFGRQESPVFPVMVATDGESRALTSLTGERPDERPIASSSLLSGRKRDD
jgi:MFS family permease